MRNWDSFRGASVVGVFSARAVLRSDPCKLTPPVPLPYTF